MSEILYMDMADVLAVHARQTQRFGGADGIRDAGLLDAAINRPQSGYYTDDFEQAAALWAASSSQALKPEPSPRTILMPGSGPILRPHDAA